ncbi:MAG: cobyrinate a,c-diamide synthase [Acidiferrobacterales bacterium]
MPIPTTNTTRHCPALLVSAPASGAGKTTVTAALARLHRRQGRRVRVFKVGPDFLDPMILERASGNPVYQLDLWMGGEAHCRQLLHEAAGAADVILIEGVMGLYDGEPSSADLAIRLGIPVLAVIQAAAMAQTFGAVAHGLASYRPGLSFAGVIANHTGSDTHVRLLADSLPASIAFFGALPRENDLTLPDRHLGLVQAAEITDLDARIDRAAELLAQSAVSDLPPAASFALQKATVPSPLLQGRRIAVARDAAFSFIYRANLELLEAMGAEIVFFSPLVDRALPEADSLYIPGGYPELHLNELEDNRAMADAIRAHHAAGKPIVAECGGMLYLLESLTDSRGQRAKLLGLLPGHATMQKRLANLGMHCVALPEGVVRGHTFHYSQMDSPLAPIIWSEATRASRRGEPVYRLGRLHAAYLHLYFPSNPEAVVRLFMPDSARPDYSVN